MPFCPACDQPYPNMEAVRAHLKKAQSEGDELHIDIVELEGWDETSSGTAVKTAADLEET